MPAGMLGLRICRDLRNALLYVRDGLQEDFNHRDSAERLRLDVLDVVDGGSKIPLRNRDNPVGHVLRDENVIGPDDADDRNIDIRKNVGWSANDREPTHDQDEYGHDHECVGPP